MRTSLLVYCVDHQSCQWARFNRHRQILEVQTQAVLGQLPTDYQNIYVLLPPIIVNLTMVDLPTRQRHRLAQAVPYALEESLTEDVDLLHFALGQQDVKTGQMPVAVIHQPTLQAYLEPFQQQGIQPQVVLPAMLALPRKSNTWSIAYEGNMAWVRTGEQSGFAIESEQLELMLQLALQETSQPPENLNVLTTSATADHIRLHSLGIPVVEEHPSTDLLTELVKGIQPAHPLNLLQGIHRPTDKTYQIWQPWRGVMVLLGIWGLIVLGAEWLNYQQLQQQRHQLTRQINQLYLQTFPESKRVVNARAQMAQKLNILRQNQGKTAPVSFLDNLIKITTALQPTPGLALQKLDYRQRTFELQLTVANLQALEQLQQRLKSLKFTVTLQSATSNNQGVVSQLKIKTE